MAAELGSVAVTISAITKKFDDAIKGVKADLKKLAEEPTKVKVEFDKTSAMAFGAAMSITSKAIDLVASGLRELALLTPRAAFAADDLNMAMHRLKVIFQDSAPQVVKTIEALQELGHPRTGLTNLAADMGLMLHGMGLSAKETANLSKQLLEMASNASVVHGMELPDFMEKLESVIAGSTRALHKMGIFLTDFQVRKEAWNLAAMGTIATTEEMQLKWARLSLVMKQLGGLAGQAEWAHKQLGGTFRETRSRLAGLLAEFGEMVKPAFIKGLQAINDILKGVSGQLKANKDAIVGWAEAFIGKATKDPLGMLNALWETIKATGKWIWDGIVSAAQAAFDKIIEYGIAGFRYLGEVIVSIFTMKAIPGMARFREILKENAFMAGPAPKEAFKIVGPEPSTLAKILGFFEKPLAPLMQFVGKARVAGEMGPAPAGGGELEKRTEEMIAQLNDQNREKRIKARKWVQAGGFAGRPLTPKEQADLLAGKGGVARKAAGIEGEPTPPLPPVNFGIKPGGPPEFMGLTDLAKKIQIAALGGEEDKQLGALLRIANATELSKQILEQQNLKREAFAVAAGPH